MDDPADTRSASYDYLLPVESIAQVPEAEREAARLLHLAGPFLLVDRGVMDFPKLLSDKDLLVLNDTRVLPGRLLGTRVATGGKADLLILERTGSHLVALLKTRGSPTIGEDFAFGQGQLHLRVVSSLGLGQYGLETADGQELSDATIELIGRVPLPPYIRRARHSDPRDELDRDRYQTVFAKAPGAVAAPTAGLHLGRRLLEAIAERGVAVATVTLHVGLGTFQPLKTDDVRDHVMHEERYEFSSEAVQAISDCRARGGRVIAIGTTAARVLETAAKASATLLPHCGTTRLFIYPGFQFQVVDALFTNFHAPRSTLLLLVSALIGRERLFTAYRHALAQGYRFLSYGDAMFLDPHAG